ncbi:transferase [Lithospermum erythrorhizon]|uniref:Glutathione S-transferase n=1 Tax=Lithospermum erythrorhizon TaxID=34254 RepID=A0AAV3RMM6_LITER
MSAEDVKILGNYYSSFVLRAKIALNIKNVKYENIEENLMNKSERLLKANPIHQKVPVLIHGEKKHICESLIIVQYIDEVWSSTTAPSILPADPHDRAMARFWAAYLDDKVQFNSINLEYGDLAMNGS